MLYIWIHCEETISCLLWLNPTHCMSIFRLIPSPTIWFHILVHWATQNFLNTGISYYELQYVAHNLWSYIIGVHLTYMLQLCIIGACHSCISQVTQNFPEIPWGGAAFLISGSRAYPMQDPNHCFHRPCLRRSRVLVVGAPVLQRWHKVLTDRDDSQSD